MIVANISIELDEITWGMEIDVRIGLDSIWKASFVHIIKGSLFDEEKILSQIQSYRGPMIDIPHTLGSLSLKLNGYPKIQKWLYQCIRSGQMNEQAYRYLQSFIITRNTTGMACGEISND